MPLVLAVYGPNGPNQYLGRTEKGQNYENQNVENHKEH